MVVIKSVFIASVLFEPDVLFEGVGGFYPIIFGKLPIIS